MNETRDPRQLRPHALNKNMPRLGPGNPAYGELIDSIAERGVTKPIIITPKDEVLDGETRRLAAIAAGRFEVPVRVVEEDEAITVICESLAQQKRLPRGICAYLIVPLAKPLLDETKRRQIANLKKGGVSRDPIARISGKWATFEDFCLAHGFSRDVADQARTIHAIFAGDAKTLKARNLEGVDVEALKADWEPRILDLEKPVGLGAALAGMAGQKATKDKEKHPPVQQLELFDQSMTALGTVFEPKRWGKTRQDDKAEIVSAWRRAAAQWPADVRAELARALTEDLTA